MATVLSPRDDSSELRFSHSNKSAMSPPYGEHELDVPNIYNMEDFDTEPVAVGLQEPPFRPAAEGPSAASPAFTQPSVTFQPTHSGFEVSAHYPSSNTMGATLLHFESTFSGRLATVHIESTGHNYLVTGTWSPQTIFAPYAITPASYTAGLAPHTNGFGAWSPSVTTLSASATSCRPCWTCSAPPQAIYCRRRSLLRC
jgi:hypothetical protein